MKLSEIKLQLQSVFESDFQGVDTFVEKVIEPIFEDEYCALPAPADILDGKPKNVLEGSNIVSAFQVGEIDTFITIRVYDITLSDNANIARSRVGIQRFVRQQIPTDTQAFILFHYEHPKGRSWRLSYLFKNNSQADTTPAKRFTYLFSADNHARTAIERFATLVGKDMVDEQPLLKAFSVEALSDEFFYEYREHYADFVQYITGKRFVKRGKEWKEIVVHEPNEELYNAFDRNDKRVRDYVKKMMGRLVFLCFLQRKGWMGNGDNEYLFNLYDNASEDVKADFLDRVLEPMFFGLLNTKPEERAVEFARQGWDISLITDAEKIPYLNGGLFEQDENDKVRSVFPCELFSNPSAKEVVKKYTSETFDYKTKRGVFDFFSAYNFTIDENDPDDAEVGVDPEMLGRIFENLLEDNKDKGAFYTPKEIVQYMCRESLIAYLQEDLMDDPTKHYIRKFVITHDAAVLAERWKEKVSQKLKDVKICDPAIGSGAFPMGLLRELFLCRSAIEGFEHAQVADIKRHIIQNNIYGVDFEKGAVDIARLRFWLSLVIDEETPRALPNLDFKIMQGNSLLEQYQGVDLSTVSIVLDDRKKSKVGDRQLSWFEQNVDETRKQLQDMINEYFTCEDHAHKKDLRNYIATNVESQIRSLNTDVDLNGVDVAENSHFFLWHTWFADVFKKGGFDIVIGNPPYIRVQNLDHELIDLYKSVFKTAWRRLDISTLFIEHLCTMLSPNGVLCYITSNQFVSAEYGRKMRHYLVNNTMIEKIVDFAGLPVFDEAITYVSIFFLNPSNKDLFLYYKVPQMPFEIPGDFQKCYFEDFDDEPWSFVFSKDKDLLKKLQKIPALSEIAFAKGGIITGSDSCFLYEPYDFPAEEELSLNVVRTNNISRYYIGEPNLKVFYPCYQDSKGNTCIYELEDIRKKYPKAYAHIMKNQDLLKARKDSRNTMGDKKFWYQPVRFGTLGLFNGTKIIGPGIVKQNKFVIDEVGHAFSFGNMYAIVSREEKYDMRVLLGILNSSLIEFYLHKVAPVKQGGYFSYGATVLERIPMIYPQSPMDKQIKLFVDQILSTKKANPKADTSALESEIDRLVYHLYNLTYDEVLIIDPETPITREQYESFE